MKTARLLKFAFSAVAQISIFTGICTSSANAATFTETTDAGASIATAVEVGPGFDAIKGFQYASTSALPHDLRDFFKLTFNTDVSFTAYDLVWPVTNPANASVHLYDASGTPLSECFNCFHTEANEGTEILSADLSMGTYFIEMRNTTGTEESKQLGLYQFSFAAVVVPEPASLMLLGFAGLAVLTTRCRRRAHA